MGAQVLVHDPYLDPARLPAGAELEPDLDRLFARSLIVSVHARLTAETTGLVSAARLALMPRGGYVVNAARGPLVDYDAVVAALDSGHLAGAAFDVFPTEPVDFGHPLFAALAGGANIVLTPHIAGASQAVAHRAAGTVAADLARYLRGDALVNPI